MRTLADELNNESFWSQICLDESGRVTAVLFAHPRSLQYLKSYPKVLLFDCTYKTNQYKTPLLVIVGINACHTIFLCCICIP